MVMGQDLECVVNVKSTAGTVHYGYVSWFTQAKGRWFARRAAIQGLRHGVLSA